jgi:sortase A
MSRKNYIAIISSALVILLGIGLMLYPKSTDIKYSLSQISMDGTAKQAKASEAGSSERVSIPEGAVAKLVIPKIDLEATVLSGTSQAVLAKGPGHYEETPLPGKKGNCAIAGHRTMHGHPFRHIDRLEKGDEIIVYTTEGRFVYRVTEKKVVEPTDLSVIAPSEEAKLTLTACHPVGSARQRLAVIAQLISE